MNDDTPSAPGGGPDPDAALRQLRSRYDDLRQDYEALLQRLSDIEARADSEEEAEPPRPAVFGQMLSPLALLRDEYIQALESLQQLIGGIDDLLPRGMKAQRASTTATPNPAGNRRLQIDVRGRSPVQLLDFRERLAGLSGVETVSIHAIDAERVVLVVQLA